MRSASVGSVGRDTYGTIRRIVLYVLVFVPGTPNFEVAHDTRCFKYIRTSNEYRTWYRTSSGGYFEYKSGGTMGTDYSGSVSMKGYLEICGFSTGGSWSPGNLNRNFARV